MNTQNTNTRKSQSRYYNEKSNLGGTARTRNARGRVAKFVKPGEKSSK